MESFENYSCNRLHPVAVAAATSRFPTKVPADYFAGMDDELDELSHIMLLFLLAGAFVHGVLSGLMAH